MPLPKQHFWHVQTITPNCQKEAGSSHFGILKGTVISCSEYILRSLQAQAYGRPKDELDLSPAVKGAYNLMVETPCIIKTNKQTTN